MAKTTNDTVTIKLPPAERHEANFITASLNGKVWKIKKGVPVTIPRALAEVIRNSEIAVAEAKAAAEAYAKGQE